MLVHAGLCEGGVGVRPRRHRRSLPLPTGLGSPLPGKW